LPQRAIEILEQNINNGSQFVFAKFNESNFSADYISKQFKKACRKAKIPENIHFHSLRHSYASMLARNGVSLYTISSLLGHTSITTTQIYSHLDNKTLFRAVETINQSKK
jgi:integrase/recombinase XerD